jgi:hypothetical protein
MHRPAAVFCDTLSDMSLVEKKHKYTSNTEKKKWEVKHANEIFNLWTICFFDAEGKEGRAKTHIEKGGSQEVKQKIGSLRFYFFF